MQDIVLASFLEIHHELDGHPRMLRPTRIGRVAAIAAQVSWISRDGHLLNFLKTDLLRALPQHGLAEGGEVLQSRGQCDEMITGKLAHLACKAHTAIGEQNFGLADPAGIKDDLTGRRIARVVLIGDAEIEIAERHPDSLAAPAHVDRLALERHGLAKGAHSFWRQLLLEAGIENKVAGADDQSAHASLR